MKSQPLSQKLFMSFSMKLLIAFSLLIPARGMAQSPVKNIVLVHGAFADGSGWQAVYEVLRSKGYNVSVVGNPNTGLADDVAAVKRTLARIDGPAILVGHSYGGVIITEAGNDPKVAGLVYISAFVPAADEPLLSLLKSSPPAPKAGIMAPEDGYVWYDKAKYHSGFCADIPAAQAAFLADSQVPVSASVFGATISSPAYKTKPGWYVLATQDETIVPDAQRFMSGRAGLKVTEVKGSHLVFMSQPKAVCDVIEKAANYALN
jgi:pimeloyl-ACP methyl ester carboxylesterase